MGKNPAFQFYPSDWTRDLDDHDLEIEGAWIRIICRLWWSGGSATKSLSEWSRILRKSNKKTSKILQKMLSAGIASGELLDNQNITITSRRMINDFRIRKIRREVGKLGGNPALIKLDNILDNQTSNQSPTPSSSFFKEKKEIKRKKRSSADASVFDTSFDAFYNLYPRKKAKERARKAWLKIKPLNGQVEQIMAALKVHIESWKGKDKDYIPHPATWLNDRRWEDEIKDKPQAQGYSKGWSQ